jgi:hypothetical protein
MWKTRGLSSEQVLSEKVPTGALSALVWGVSFLLSEPPGALGSPYGAGAGTPNTPVTNTRAKQEA